MYIERFSLNNYKSWRSSPEISLEPGFNVIIGRNNAGKTALAEALSLHFVDKPHRSLITAPIPQTPIDNTSEVRFSLVASSDEATNALLSHFEHFWVPIPDHYNTYLYNNNVDAINELLGELISPHCVMHCVCRASGIETAIVQHPQITSSAARHSVRVKSNKASWQVEPVLGVERRAHQDQYPYLLAQLLRERVYLFNAQRRSLDRCPIGTSSHLLPDASNLGEVLQVLSHSDPALYQQYIRNIHAIFPDIHYITVPNVDTDNVCIYLWPIPLENRRPDLALPLSESGTGVGQVLALLYVVLTSAYPRILVIDEPQSFLHPGAVQALIEILKMHPQHQYIIVTHSPVAITYMNPQRLLRVTKHDAESQVISGDITETQHIQALLAELGTRPSDIFGAENILWVEGPTEELCFPLILEQLTRRPLFGTRILGVLHTGDFERKHAERTIAIYERLSEIPHGVPPALGFIFDREDRTNNELEDLKRRGKGLVHFIRRKMYENYLLHPQAIAFTLSRDNRDENGNLQQITEQEVSNWLTDHSWDPAFRGTHADMDAPSDEFWRENVDAAKLLIRMFSQLTDARVNYDKVAHGLVLTKWLLENAPEELTEISELINNVLPAPQNTA